MDCYQRKIEIVSRIWTTSLCLLKMEGSVAECVPDDVTGVGVVGDCKFKLDVAINLSSIILVE